VPVGQPQKAETLVGRGNKIEVIQKNGAVKEINRKDLPLLNRARGPAQSPASAAPPGESDKKPAEGTEPTQENPGTTPSQEQGKEGGSAAEPIKKAEPEPPGKREKAEPEAKTAQEDAKEVKQKAAAKQAAKEKAEAIKQSNIEGLRKLEYQNAWFYDKSGKPISREELDKRIEKGDVGDIRATDIYLRNWKTEPEKTPDKGQGESAPSGADMQGK
jgi:outer membrane biosynthesis protein TonB